MGAYADPLPGTRIAPLRPPRRRLDRRRLIALALLVILAVLVLPLVAILIRTSLGETLPSGEIVGVTAANFIGLLSEPRLAQAFGATLVFAGGSAMLALLVGASLAWVVERTNTPLKGLASLTAIVSMGTPYVLYIIAWLFLLGKTGPFNGAWRALSFGADLINVNSMAGMILIEGFLWSPLTFLMLSAQFRSANADLEEAARMCGATVWQTVRLVSLRLVTPAVVALAMFVFIRAIEGFEVPLLVGTPSGIRVLTTGVYETMRLVPPQLGQSAALSVLLLVLVGVMFTFYGQLAKNGDKYQSVTGKAFRPRPFDLGRGRWVAGLFIALYFTVVLVLPILALVWLALLPYAGGVSWAMLQQLTLDNFAALRDTPDYLEYGVNTLLVAFGAATAVTLLTAFAGWICARRGPFAWAIDQLATAPLIFPGIVMGVAVLQIFLRVPLPIYGTLWILLIAYLIRYVPYGMRYSYAGVLQIHRELEEAAGVSGASVTATLHRIVAPLLAPSAVAAWIFVFLICAKELALAVLLSSPSSKVLAVAMLDLWTNGQTGELAALGLAWTAVMTVLAAVAFRLAKHSQRGTFGQ